MKLNIKIITTYTFIIVFLACQHQGNNNHQGLIVHSEAQFEYAIKNINSLKSVHSLYPRSIEKGKLKLVGPSDWTSGFFPGNLWMMYELSGNEIWKKRALEYTLPLESEKWNAHDHDIGFKMFNSFGKAIKHDTNPAYKDILIQSAKTLSTRYDPIVGCIRSWDSNPKTEHWKYPVIIDNMMNLELLMWAARETGNESFREIAVKHAQTTMKNHFRKDYSCYHVIDYDPETGEVINKNTHQGAADESGWSRGQAWALYGFTMMYRETKLDEFFVQAEHIANYLINQNNIKEGAIPYWDFNAPNIPNEPLDASAGAVISAALFELFEFSGNEEHIKVARKLLKTLSSPEFMAQVGDNEGFLLKHSTGSLPFNSEIDVPIVYADYYFLESIIKNIQCEKNLTLAQNQLNK